MRTWTPKAAISFYLSAEDEKDIRLLAYATNQNMTEFMSVICKKIIKKNRAFLDEFKEITESARKKVKL